MDKNQFNSVLRRFTKTTKREAEEILSLKSQFPYSQLLTALAARVSKDHGFTIHTEELSSAAVHAADRAVLKDVITYSPTEVAEAEEQEEVIPTPSHTPETKVEQKVEEVTQEKIVNQSKAVEEPKKQERAEENEKKQEPIEAKKEVAPVRSLTPPEKIVRYDVDSDDVAGEVMKDLKKLSQLKHNFEMLLTDYADSANRSEKVTPKKNGAPSTPTPTSLSKPDQPLEKKEVEKPEKPKTPPGKSSQKESLKVRRERMIAHAKSLQASDEETKKKGPQDEIIDDIKKNNAEIKPESEKQKQQINIINQFIKAQPSISNPKVHTPQTSGDLSPIKTGEFGDKIISETLVEILVKQGKKDKAIEVLKKLIWKYPQKKAYFASQIEELKK